MSNINLNTCTKEQLKKSIGYMLNKARCNKYLYLEDIYTKNPTLSYENSCNENAFAEINCAFYGLDDKTNKPINALIDKMEDYDFETNLNDFTDRLFDYIVNEYGER